jgi:hypothetical protein
VDFWIGRIMGTEVKTQKTEVGVVNSTMAPRRKYRGLTVFPTNRFNMGQSFKLEVDLIRDGWRFSLL